MDEKLLDILRNILNDRYGVDTSAAKVFFSTQNYAFIFPDSPYMIRVSITPRKTRREILSEIMWLDDVKSFAATICEPSPSLRGNMLEEFEIEDVMYRAAMFRTAIGKVKPALEMDSMFFLCVGELLGKVHKASTSEREIGMNFKRSSLSDNFDKLLALHGESIPKSILDNITRIRDRVHSLPQELGHYGLCHGDFHLNNFFVDNNNIWLFDFDSCCYADYLYDIAAFIQSCLLFGYRSGDDMKSVIYDDMVRWFRIGYEMNHTMTEEHWAQLESLIAYRTAYTYLALAGIDECGVTDDIMKIKQFFSFLLTQEDIAYAMTQALKK